MLPFLIAGLALAAAITVLHHLRAMVRSVHLELGPRVRSRAMANGLKAMAIFQLLISVTIFSAGSGPWPVANVAMGLGLAAWATTFRRPGWLLRNTLLRVPYLGIMCDVGYRHHARAWSRPAR